MPRYSANLSILYTELPFTDRFAAARKAGFEAVECWFPYDVPAAELRQRLDDLSLSMVGINSPHGETGEWGIAAIPGREQAFEDSIRMALDYAQEIGSGALHVMAGLTGALPQAEALATYYANLEVACRLADGTPVQLLIEPLNQMDRPGYALSSVEHAAQIVDRAGLSSLRIMFDIYHVQRQQGDVLPRLRRYWKKIGHIQFAGCPDRGPPDTGELNYRTIFAEIDRLGWPGWLGAEYLPGGPTEDSLGWMTTL